MSSEQPFLDFPLTVSPTGSLSTTGADDHLRDLILQVLFTEPGERVNLPEFGCGVKRLVFSPNSEITRATTQFLITHNLQRWLGELIDVDQVKVSSPPGEDERLEIEIVYSEKRSRARSQLRVTP